MITLRLAFGSEDELARGLIDSKVVGSLSYSPGGREVIENIGRSKSTLLGQFASVLDRKLGQLKPLGVKQEDIEVLRFPTLGVEVLRFTRGDESCILPLHSLKPYFGKAPIAESKFAEQAATLAQTLLRNQDSEADLYCAPVPAHTHT